MGEERWGRRAQGRGSLVDFRRELRTAFAVARKDFRFLGRYPINSANLVLLPLYQFLIPGLLLGVTFLVAGRAVGLARTAGTTDVAGFLFLGALGASLSFGVFWGVTWTLQIDIGTGALEAVWQTPARRAVIIFGNAISSLAISSLAGVVLVVIGTVIFGSRYAPQIILAAPAMLLAMVGLVGITYLVAAAVLVAKEASFVVDISSYLFVLFSGAMFPVTVFPQTLRLIAYGLPVTPALDILRHYALGTPELISLSWEYTSLVVMALVYPPLGLWVFRAAERRLRTQGSLGQH